MFYFYHISHISHRLPSCVPERAAFLKNKILKIKARNKKKATAQREQLSFSTVAFFLKCQFKFYVLHYKQVKIKCQVQKLFYIAARIEICYTFPN